MPINPLSELIKQDIGSNIKTDVMKNPLWLRLLPYFILNSICLILWGLTYPGWTLFITDVLKASDPILVQNLIEHLVPYYVFFTFALILNGVFYGFGRTDLLALKAFFGNIIISIMFILFSYEIGFTNDVFSIATIFGIGLICGLILSLLLFIFFILRIYSNLAAKIVV